MNERKPRDWQFLSASYLWNDDFAIIADQNCTGHVSAQFYPIRKRSLLVQKPVRLDPPSIITRTRELEPA